MKRHFVLCLSILFALAPSAAQAATVTPLNGQVLISQGNGYFAISAPVTVGPGTSVMAYPGASARISYSPGCNVSVAPGSVVAIAEQSPCNVAAEEFAAAETVAPEAPVTGVDFTTIAIGAGVVAGGIGLAVAASGVDDDKKRATSP